MTNGKLIIQASQFGPYEWLRQANRELIDRLVRAGNIVLRSYVDEEGSEFLAHRDRRWYPMVTTSQVVKIVRQVNASKIPQMVA